MEIIKESSDGSRVCRIPELVSFGRELHSISYRHCELVVNGKEKLPSKASVAKHQKELEFFEVVPEEEEWSKSMDKKLSALIGRWEKVASNIQKSVRKHYASMRDELKAHIHVNDVDDLVLPEVSDELNIGDYFTVHSIFFD